MEFCIAHILYFLELSSSGSGFMVVVVPILMLEKWERKTDSALGLPLRELVGSG